MKNIFIGIKTFQIPSHWNELEKDDLLYIAHLFSHNHTKEEMVVLLTCFFSEMKIQDIVEVNPAIFIEMENQFNFLFKEIKLTKQHLSEIRINLKRFEGPKQGLSNFNYEQFIIFAETYYFRYIETKQEQYLNSFLACLYTRKNKIFDPEKIEQNAHTLRKLSVAEKTAILLFYQGSRNFLVSQFPILFAKGNEKKSKKEEYNFLEVIELLNAGDVSKNNIIRKTNIYEIFTRLTNLKKESEKNGRK